jgi:hypothetical protein
VFSGRTALTTGVCGRALRALGRAVGPRREIGFHDLAFLEILL